MVTRTIFVQWHVLETVSLIFQNGHIVYLFLCQVPLFLIIKLVKVLSLMHFMLGAVYILKLDISFFLSASHAPT
jgi:hypothetical protein